jgi:hypothetical protein
LSDTARATESAKAQAKRKKALRVRDATDVRERGTAEKTDRLLPLVRLLRIGRNGFLCHFSERVFFVSFSNAFVKVVILWEAAL